jgi:hypothetical protein
VLLTILVMKVRLVVKLAQMIDGVDLSNHDVGDVLDLPERKGRLLIAEGWAVAERRDVGSTSRVLAFRRQRDLGHWRDDRAS